MDDQSAEVAEDAAPAQASAPADDGAAGSGLTDEHHDWVSSFCGIDTRAASSTDSSSAPAASPDPAPAAVSSTDGGGGLWGAITGAASSVASTVADVASDVGHTVSDAASGVVNTAETVAGDVGQTVSDAAGGVINTVETAAGGIEHTVADAAGGIIDTASKVAGDIGSGNLGQALSDTEDGIVTTTGRVVSDAAHAVVDTGSAALEAAGKVVTDTQQTVADAATGVINTAGTLVGDVAHTVSDAAGPDSMIGQAANAVGGVATAAAGAAVDTVRTAADFSKGVVEGVVGGVEGLAKGVVNLADSAGKEVYALATDEKAREDALNTVEHGVEAVGRFAETAVTDPGKAASEVGDAVVSGAEGVAHMAGGIYDQYQQAAAAGHGAEFIGKGVGQAAVLVAGAVLTDGASVAAEGGAVAAEGAAVLGEGAVVAEGAGALAEGAGALGEGAAVGEGTALAGEEAAGAASTAEAQAATSGAGEALGEGAQAGAGESQAAAEVEQASSAATPLQAGPDEASFEGLIDNSEFENDPAVVDRLSRAREGDIGGYKSLTGKGEYGRVGDGLDSDEALQNAKIRQMKNVARDSEVAEDNPAMALSRDVHKTIKNLRGADLEAMSPNEVLQYHLDQMKDFVPDYALKTLQQESEKFIGRLGGEEAEGLATQASGTEAMSALEQAPAQPPASLAEPPDPAPSVHVRVADGTPTPEELDRQAVLEQMQRPQGEPATHVRIADSAAPPAGPGPTSEALEEMEEEEAEAAAAPLKQMRLPTH